MTARLQRIALITASLAVMATTFVGGNGVKEAPPNVERVIATPIPIRAFKPMTISIPKIDLEAPIVPVWTLSDGTMQSPSTATDVGWWAGRKAGKGNLLLDGHHDWNGRQGSFYKLPKLKKGDEVIVTGDDPTKTLTYRIVWLKNYDRNIDATKLLGNKSKKQVATLITCGGTFDTIARTHRERVVARAELVTT